MTLFTRRGRRAALTAGTALTIAAALLGGCSAANQSASGSTGSAPEPVTGGTLQIANNSDAQPGFVLAGRQGNASWAADVFETLTAYDADGTPQPLLAKSWTLADDQKSIGVVLRDDVTFSSGRTMTADDVKFSFEKAADPETGSQVAFIAKQFKSIDVTSDTELTITFAQPLSNIFDFFEQTFIVDQDTYDGLQDGSQVVGTGPFLFSSWDPGSKIVLKRNDAYWGEKPYLDEIDVAIITDSTAMINGIRSGRIQYAIGLSGTDIKGFDGDPQHQVVSTPSGAFYPLGFDVTKAPFDKKEVRQAVEYAIDRQRIADQVFGGLATPTTQFWLPSAPGYDKALNDTYAYDPDKARQMLQDAGATGASFTINVIGLDPNTSAAEIVANNLKEVGLNPTVNVLETTAFGPRQNKADLGTAFMALHGSNGYGPATLQSTLPAIRPNNASHFDTPQYKELRAAVATATGDEAAAANKALAEYLVDQAFNLPLVYSQGDNIVSSDVYGTRVTQRAYLDNKATYIAE